MGREGVTYEQYKEVADKLKADGIKPTVRNVRAELGTGSNATLLVHQNRYIEKQHPVDSNTIELPTLLVNAIKHALIEAANKATVDIESSYQDAHNQLSDDEKMLAESEQLITSLKIELNENTSQAEQRERELDKSLAATQKQVEDFQKQFILLTDKLNESIRAQEVARIESAKAQLQVERADKTAEQAEKRNENLIKDLEKIKKSNTEADKKAAAAEAVTNEQSKAIIRLEKDLIKAINAADKTEKRHDLLQVKYETVKDKIEKRYDLLQAKYEAVNTEKASASQQAAVAETIIKGLEEQNKQLKIVLENTNKQKK